ncbi:hydroxyacid dehydrogenase [Saccharopolyspora phatthalungensis]|uniref:D-3-phosphoglycerate dehydrogenase n=1 Tax=Saccharopolyspora phatthalungensis TaxID=664693 RepID=A0A840QHL3_9PSEU|nr:hydroxyacid dehydrogenase [Saccharopolyspora phatthalungensis]MBB5159500.1 D-3-phosphoglycerate dehydrogenase [Saccharopolyspora phatthalungensis]
MSQTPVRQTDGPGDRTTGRPPARVLLVDPIHDDAIARMRRTWDVVVRLRPSADELLRLVSDIDVIVVRSGVRLPATVFEHAPNLKVVARAGSGTDNIDLDAARRAGVVVFNVPGQSATAVAELTVGLLLAVTRKIALADRQVRANVWNKPALEGVELTGKTLGIVGFGAIGSRIARIAGGFSQRVLTAVDRVIESRRDDLAARGAELVDLGTLLAESDFVCVAVPLNDRTRGLIGAAELRAMKRSAYLVNISRGAVIDESALHTALRDGVIAGAALDVHSKEGQHSGLAELDNVVLTPHIGAMSADAQRVIGDVVVDSVTAALDGRAVANRVC